MGWLTYFGSSSKLETTTIIHNEHLSYPLYTHNGQIRVAQLAIWHHISESSRTQTQDGVCLSPIWYVNSNGCKTHRSPYGCCRPPPCRRCPLRSPAHRLLAASFFHTPLCLLPVPRLVSCFSHAILLAAWFPVSFFL